MRIGEPQLEERSPAARPPSDRGRDSGTDPENASRKPHLGSPSDPRRAPQARVHARAVDSLPVSAPAPQASLAELANFPPESSPRSHRHRLRGGADRNLPAAVR